MNKKQLTGLFSLLIGVVLFFLAMYAEGRLSSVKSGIDAATQPFSGSGYGKVAGGMVEHQVSKYDKLIFAVKIASGVLVIAGLGMMICCRKK